MCLLPTLCFYASSGARSRRGNRRRKVRSQRKDTRSCFMHHLPFFFLLQIITPAHIATTPANAPARPTISIPNAISSSLHICSPISERDRAPTTLDSPALQQTLSLKLKIRKFALFHSPTLLKYVVFYKEGLTLKNGIPDEHD